MSHDETERSAPEPGARTLLRNRSFRLIWLGQAISDFGDSLTSLALLILVNNLSGSTAALATVAIVLAIPQVTIGLIAGVYVDRLDRRRMMLLSDLLRGLLVLGFAMVGSADAIWLLYLIAFVQATIGTFFNPARSALLPQLVSPGELLSANSLMQTSKIIAGLLGTAAAGILVGVLNQYWPIFLIDGLTFFASFLLISQIATAPRSQAGARIGDARAILRELGVGVGFVLRSRTLIGTLVVAGVMMLGLGAVNVLFVPLLLNDLKISTTWLGALELAQISGMVLSGSLVALIAARFAPGQIISAGAMALGVGVGMIALADSVWHVIAILFAVGVVTTPLQASVTTLTQTAVADEVRGRVGSALSALISTASLISMAAAGGLGDSIGIRNVFICAGATSLLAGIAAGWMLRQPQHATILPTKI